MVKPALKVASARVAARLATAFEALPESAIAQAMAYSLEGGKGLRGYLVLESAQLYGVSEAQALSPAAAIEALHAYSLVHDDLPCMDDDDLRRGRPTVHKAWDEATAVLVGDALQSLAFELVADPAAGLSGLIRADLVVSLARAAGAEGMVLGQAQDLAAETAKRPLTLTQITALQANKTGALIRWSAEAGARMALADPKPMTDYSTALGLAFQIADDILDVEGDPDKAGKRLQKDADAGKATFVGLMGLDGAKSKAKSLVEEACAAIAPFGPRAESLRKVAQFVIERES
ncbi:MAG: polyprenyl synthetase family protein [Mangrovicoccus sp.]